MNRSTALTLIFIGAITLYVFAVGLVMPFQQFSLVGDNVNQPWDTIPPWQISMGGVSTSIVSGNLRFQPGVGGGAMCVVYLTPTMGWTELSKLTLEFKTKVVTWAGGSVSFQLYTTSGWSIVAIYQDQVAQQIDSTILFTPLPNPVNNDWHVYTVTFDLPASAVVFYIDSVEVARWSQVAHTVMNTRIAFGMLCTVNGGEALTDYLNIDAGIKPPGTSPPPEEHGTLRIFASYGGAYVQASAVVSGTESKPSAFTTTDVNNPLSYSLQTGTYTVTITYNSATRTDSSFTLTTAGHDTNLNFGGTPPSPPPDDTTILDKILAYLKDPTVKALGSLVSVVFIGIGAIGMVSKPKRESPKPPYPPESYY